MPSTASPRSAVEVAAPEVRRVDERRPGRVQLGQRRVEAAVGRGVERARCRREVGRAGEPQRVGVPAGVDGDPFAVVDRGAAEERRVGQRRTGGVQLGDEDVVRTPQRATRSAGGGREVGRQGLAGDVRVAGRVDGDAAGAVDVGAPEVGRVGQCRPGRVQLEHEAVGVVDDAPRAVRRDVQAAVERAAGGREVRGLRRSRDVRVAGGVDREPRCRTRDRCRRRTSSTPGPCRSRSAW